MHCSMFLGVSRPCQHACWGACCLQCRLCTSVWSILLNYQVTHSEPLMQHMTCNPMSCVALLDALRVPAGPISMHVEQAELFRGVWAHEHGLCHWTINWLTVNHWCKGASMKATAGIPSHALQHAATPSLCLGNEQIKSAPRSDKWLSCSWFDAL